MRLTSIHLSGFKSFVEPTHLQLSGNLTGIVGPNGCGKSNIIDAITWAMGESSARHLRAKSLTDVIFNGSTDHQPTGQAFVELVFDNSKEKLGGQYAQFDTLSIKRILNRSGDSHYFLNGTRCRRRDITDLFLGTGLGPRNYAFIEQGMIHQLVEAQPDQFRVFIEEAAGISEYRERRNETRRRIGHTQDNIDRLNDIRSELDNQLKGLKKQAVAAKRYQELKQQEKTSNAGLLAMQWQNLEAKRQNQTKQIAKQKTDLEKATQKLRQIEADIITDKQALADTTDKFNTIQTHYYAANAEVSRLEQEIAHLQRRIATENEQLQETQQQLEKIESQKRLDQTQYNALITEKNDLTPKLETARTISEQVHTKLQQAEQQFDSWQNHWDTLTGSLNEIDNQKNIIRTHIELLQTNIMEIKTQKSSQQTLLNELPESSLEAELGAAIEDRKKINALLQSTHEKLQAEQQNLQDLRTVYIQKTNHLNNLYEQEQKNKGRLASLEALQKSAQPKQNTAVTKWLEKNKLTNAPRLAQMIQVDPKWTYALETVLEADLQSLCIESLTTYLDTFSNLSGELKLLELKQEPPPINKKRPTLADKLIKDPGIGHRLRHIYIAKNLATAYQLLTELKPHESVITQTGVWIGPNWIWLTDKDSTGEGMLSWEQEITKTKATLAKYNTQIKAEQIQIQQIQITKKEQYLETIQQYLQRQQTQVAKATSLVTIIEAKQEQTYLQKDQIRKDLMSKTNQLEQYHKKLNHLNTELTALINKAKKLQTEKTAKLALRDEYQNTVETARHSWQESHQKTHGIDLKLGEIIAKQASLKLTLVRNNEQTVELQKRIQAFETMLTDHNKTLEENHLALETALQRKLTEEKSLATQQKTLQSEKQKLADNEQQRLAYNQTVNNNQSTLSQTKLQEREYVVKQEAIIDTLKGKKLEYKHIPEQLSPTTTITTLKDDLDKIKSKIERLGPINLTAIDEFAELSKRKEYLDSQNNDLNRALASLQKAIRQIDKETRLRFQKTFERLNANLKEIFPQLFGGGRAYLALTDTDLLKTGATIMAQPPGKKNNSIHLLSGGEKALTSVAMLFAIFKLNPAPFCILDEIDAPLDDVNIDRFTRMVQDMAKTIQFIFITHNKLTMEIAQQLIGVTMQEAGVSRLVSVDIDKVIKTSATA